MDILERAKNICLEPQTEWDRIAAEPSTAASLITGYVLPLAAIGAVAGLVGGSLVGHSLPFLGTYRVPIASGLVMAIFAMAMAVVSVFLLSVVINALAPTFGAQPNQSQALKVAVYSYTPAWVAGVLQILPALRILVLLAALYGLYLLYLGLLKVMKSPADRAAGYAVIVVVCAIVMSVVIAVVGGLLVGTGMMGVRNTMIGGAAPEVQYDRNSPLGKLQEFSKKMEESGRKMDAAQKSGDANAQVTAALEGLGTLFGGGRRVDPMPIDQLKPFVPETFAGLPKTDSSAEKTGIAGLMVSKAEATYSDGAGRSVRLDISDTGGVSGLVGLASWVGMQGEKEDESGSERTVNVDGRLVHERVSKRGGPDEFALVLGGRFIVSAKGTGVGLSELKTAVSSLDLTRLEAMKNVGVQK